MKSYFFQNSHWIRFQRFCVFAILAISISSISAEARGEEATKRQRPKTLEIRESVLAQIRINPLQPGLPLQLRIRAQALQNANPAPQLAPGQPPDENSASGGIGLSTNRAMIMKLERSKKLTDEKKYSEAIAIYEDILKSPNDFFFKPDPQKPFHKSIKSEVRQILGTLPAEGRDAYAMNYNIVAQKMLDEALASGDMDRLSDIARVYFHTPAGKQATWIYGRYCLDHNQPLAAAMSFQTLYELTKQDKTVDQSLSMILALAWYRSGMGDRAMPLLEELRASSPTGLDWNDKKVSWYENPQQIDQWMANAFGERHHTFINASQSWGLFRGNLSRNLVGAVTSPLLSSKWRYDFEKESKAQEIQTSLIEKEFRVESKSNLPTTQPLAVGNLILLQKADEIVGVNFETGERIWQYPPSISASSRVPDQAIQNELNAAAAARRPPQFESGNPTSRSLPPSMSKLTLSMDNQQAYLVENLDAAIFGSQFTSGVRPRTAVQQSNNILSALDIKKEGYLKWQVGGRTGEAEPRLASVFFQGAPLPLNNQLYILGEIGNEMSLYCLDAESGRLQWSQSLYVYERSLAQDFERKKINLVPSYSDGIMVCPTLSGNVIAVDLFNRTLLWAQNYEAPAEESEFDRRAARFGSANRYQALRQHWTDAVATVAHGKVLLAPPDLDSLICIDLFSGALNWKLDKSETPDQSPLYLAGTENGVSVIVGKSMIYGIRIEDKSVAWTVNFGESSPSGRGYMSRGHYYLPLSSAEVWKVEFKTGKIVARSKSRDGSAPGNLITYNGHVLSMDDKSLSCYHSLDERQKWATEALRTNPNDAEALFAVGEIQLCDAKLDQAIASLEKSWNIGKSTKAKTTLSDALTQRLAGNFLANTQSIPKIKELLKDSPEADTFSTLLIKNYLKENKRAEALNEILAVGNGSLRNEFEDTEPGKLIVRQDRWLLSVVDDLRKKSSPEEWSNFRSKLENVAKTNSSQSTQQMWRDILFSLDPASMTSEWHQSVIDEHLARKDHLRAELAMLAMRNSSSPKTAAEGLHNLIKLDQQLGQNTDLLSLIDDLRFDVLDQSIGDTTGASLAEKLLNQDTIGPLARGPSHWPRENVKHSTVQRVVTRYTYPIDVHVDRGGVSNDVRLVYDSSNTYEISAIDGKGNTLYAIPIRDFMSGRIETSQAEQYQARFVGHMLIVSLMKSIAAFDTLSIEKGRPKLLWKRDFSNLISDELIAARNDGFAPPAAGRRKPISRDQNGNVMAVCNAWLVCNEFVFVQRNSKLIAFDSYSGEILWIRQDTRLASDVACDGKKVCLLTENGRDSQVYDARTGMMLDPITVPAGERHHTRGMKLLYSSVENSKREVHVFDLETQKHIWSLEPGSAIAKVTMIDGREVAIFDQRGYLYIVDFETGKGPKGLKTGDLPFKSYLNRDDNFSVFEVKRDFDRYYVVVGHPTANQSGRSFGSMLNGSRVMNAISGWAYAIDRNGGTLSWEFPLSETSFPNLQPNASPLLIFGVNLNETTNGNYEQHFKYTLIDKKSGKLIANDRTNPVTQLQLNIDDEKKQVNLVANTGTIQVTFAEPPKVNSPPEDSPKKAKKPARQEE